ncbi:hypothetical protein BACI9J_60099 [Bacillus altitudinis]|nr:hypothetical protein BACI9J_60099 [Bacillus altitudinis]
MVSRNKMLIFHGTLAQLGERYAGRVNDITRSKQTFSEKD